VGYEGHKKFDIETAAQEERIHLRQLFQPNQQDVKPVEEYSAKTIQMMYRINKKSEEKCKRLKKASEEL